MWVEDKVQGLMLMMVGKCWPVAISLGSMAIRYLQAPVTNIV